MRDTMKIIKRHYIDGAFIESHGREALDSINPTNGNVVARAEGHPGLTARAIPDPIQEEICS